MSIKNNLIGIRESLPAGVRLVAVSKTRPVSDLMEAYNLGQRLFGENRVQELLAKKDIMPTDVEWHIIGHLQSNKVKYVAPFIGMVHSVDSLKLLKVIDFEASRNSRVINCLLQFHIAMEETKFGFSYDEAVCMLESVEFKELQNIRLCGVMGMATFSDDKELVRGEFRTLKGYFDSIKNSFFKGVGMFNEISMGMSDDYKIAVEEGSTLVRVGSSIFGKRN